MGMIKIVPDDEAKRLQNTPVNRGLKRWAIIAFVAAMLLRFTAIFCSGVIPKNYVMVINGCAGVGAIVFVILFGLLTYRVNRKYIEDR